MLDALLRPLENRVPVLFIIEEADSDLTRDMLLLLAALLASSMVKVKLQVSRQNMGIFVSVKNKLKHRN